MPLTLEQGEKLIALARHELEIHFKDRDVERWDITDSEFNKKYGVFVTLYKQLDKKKELRGCIGFVQPKMPLWESVREAVKASAFEDMRFLPLTKEELNKVLIEISILSPFKMIETSENMGGRRHETILHEIEVGRDGLIIEYSGFSGLLLPQVAVESKLDEEHFLEQTCIKAGVSPQTWKNKSCKIYKFSAQIFAESAKGKVKEIKLK